MSIHKLRAVDHCPGQIDGGLAAIVRGGLEMAADDPHFVVRGIAGEDHQVQGIDDIDRPLGAGEHFLDAQGLVPISVECATN